MKYLLIILVILGFVTSANAQTITKVSWDQPACMNPFDAPKGTTSYENFIKNDLPQYLEDSIVKRKYNTWGRLEGNEFHDNPIVAFQLFAGFFAIELGSLDFGRRDYIKLFLHANSCSDLELHQSDGSSRPIAHISAHLQFPGNNEFKVDEIHGALLDYRSFLEAIANGTGPLVVTRLNGISYKMSSNRITDIILHFQIMDYKIPAEKRE